MIKPILIAVPCLDMVCADFAFSLGRLMTTYRDPAEVLDIRGSEISHARNLAVQHALAGDFSHLLFLDSDMNIPGNTLHRLLAWGKPIVGASYVRRCEPYDLLGRPATSWAGGGLVEAAEMPTGCLLISMAALRKIEWPWFRFEYGPDPCLRTSEDIYFCRKATAAGIKIWCDTDLTKEIGHVGTKRYTVRDGIEHISRRIAATETRGENNADKS